MEHSIHDIIVVVEWLLLIMYGVIEVTEFCFRHAVFMKPVIVNEIY
jgi:hypothetical protein